MYKSRLLQKFAIAVTLLLVALPSVEAQQHGLGLVPAAQKDFDRYPSVKMSLRDAEPVPDHFTLEAYLPPIGNQGDTGSCVGWSTAYYCYSMSVARQRKLSDAERTQSKFLFSPGWIWNQYNDGDSERGMQIFQAFDVLEKMGCASLAEFPWEEKAIPFKPSEAAKQKAEFYKARRTLVLFRGATNGEPADPERMRRWLADTKSPIVMGIPIYSDFPKGSVGDDFVYAKKDDNAVMRGYHAICVIGYDKNLHAFEMVNSWGEKWGNHGKLWLAENFIRDYAIQGCVQAPGGPRIRGYQFAPAPSAADKIPSLP